MECYEAALEELQSVRDYAPREASVYFIMGKIYKLLGRRDEAMSHFTTAQVIVRCAPLAASLERAALVAATRACRSMAGWGLGFLTHRGAAAG